MQPISGLISGAAPASISGVREAPKVQRSEDQAPERSLKPAVDEFVPEEKQEPSGRYWLGQDEDGQPKVYFDDPDRAESCTCNTDKVDRELEALRRKQEALMQQRNSETDSSKIQALEKKLAQIEGELRQKDNDAYRRQHASFSEF